MGSSPRPQQRLVPPAFQAHLQSLRGRFRVAGLMLGPAISSTMNSDAQHRLRNLSVGVLCGAVAGMLQGAMEAGWTLGPAGRAIFRPQDVFELLLPRTIRKLVPGDDLDSLPFILDVFVGPDLLDRLPILLRVVALYTLVGGLVGGGLWVVWSIVKRIFPESTGELQTGPVYVSTLICLGVVSNLLAYLSRLGLLDIEPFAGVVVVLSLVANAIWIWPGIYRLTARLLSSHESASSTTGGRAFVYVTAVALIGIVVGGTVSAAVHLPGSSPSYSISEPAGQSRDAKPGGPNVVLISIDSLRADHLSSYGYPRQTSPNIDRLAAEGVLFSQAISTTSWTLPSHVSLLTGLLPEAHGVQRPRHTLPGWPVTLAELMTAEGYQTAAVVSAPFLNSSYGMDQGFAFYDDESVAFSSNADSHVGTTAPQVHEAAGEWLRASQDERFFLFVHYWDVHYDYNPPPPYDTLFDPGYDGDINANAFESNPRIHEGMPARDLAHIEALYDGEIAFTDDYIGQLLDLLEELDLTSNTLVILTADHGDEFFEHGNKGHYKNLHEEVLRIPLIMRLPGELPSGVRIDDVVSLVDIAPTILDLVGVESRPPMQGRSLLPWLSGESSEAIPGTGYASFLERQAAVRSASEKYIYFLSTGRSQLYDLVADPQEQEDLAKQGETDSNPRARAAIAELVDWLNLQRDFRRSVPEEAAEATTITDPELLQELRSLGYID